MKTYFEITNGKNYRQLSALDKELIQDRQTHLAIAWQDEKNIIAKLEIEDELMASFTGLIKGMAYRQAEKSFSLDQEEFEGIISLAFAETLIAFDRTLEKPFQPVFITMVRYAILEMYREKGYDLHDTSDKLDKIVNNEGERTTSLSDITDSKFAEIGNSNTLIVVDEILTELFGDNERKKTVIHMMVQGFKRNEIVSAVMEEGKSQNSVERMINRSWSEFKSHYVNLMHINLV